jgi:Protein of unknown function (DUF1573)
LGGVKKIPGFVLLFLAGIVACPAALEWKTTEVQATAQPGQVALTVTFPFRNTGDHPVRILSLDPSCSCMSAVPNQAVCAPGESGEISVELALTGYAGRLRRAVTVTTDAVDGKFAELTLTVEIPELVAITPRFLFWRVGAAPEEKAVEIVITDPKTTKLDGTECANPHFQAQLSPGPSGAFRLAVKPADTRQPDEAMIHLKVVVSGREQEFVVYAAVK